MRRILAFVLVPLLLLTGCTKTGEEEAPPPQPPTPVTLPRASYAPDDIVLMISEGGAFVPAQFLATELPHVVVYGDGRVITGRPHWSDRDVGLPHLRVHTISADAVRQLVVLALAAGVGARQDYGYPPIADVSTTSFDVLTADGSLATHVYALTVNLGLTDAQRAARQRLIDLQDALTNPVATLGLEVAGPPRPYAPGTVAVTSRPWDENAPSKERAWPAPALPGQPLPVNPLIGPDNLSCVEATGADLDAVLGEANAATEATAWLRDGQRYRIWFRPLLPHESSCADL
jgi:hypothetical protein